MKDKLDKAIVLYMGPELLDRAGRAGTVQTHGAVCGKCMMFIKTSSQCEIVCPPEVSGNHGVCGLFVGGAPKTGGSGKAHNILSQEVAGYIEQREVPTMCGNCEYYLALGMAQGECRKVEGIVHQYGCCNVWEARNHLKWLSERVNKIIFKKGNEI